MNSKRFIVAAAAVMFSLAMMAQPQGRPQGQPGQHGSRGGWQQMTPEQSAKMQVGRMNEALKLSEDQTKQLYDLFFKEAKDRAAQMEAFKKAHEEGKEIDRSSFSREDFMKQMEERNAKIAKILTPEQNKKWAEIQEQMRQRGPQGGGRPGQGDPRRDGRHSGGPRPQ